MVLRPLVILILQKRLHAEAFSSVFVNEPYGPLPESCYQDQPEICIESIIINDSDILKELNKLNIYKSMGPDNIHPKLLKALTMN